MLDPLVTRTRLQEAYAALTRAVAEWLSTPGDPSSDPAVLAYTVCAQQVRAILAGLEPEP